MSKSLLTKVKLAKVGRRRSGLRLASQSQHVVTRPADRQLLVAKEVRGGATFAGVGPVAGDERVTEVARMLAGSSSSAALDHARDLLNT